MKPKHRLLICKTKDEEVVKYALNRNMSPTMVAEYETKLITKSLLQRKLHELSEDFSDIERSEVLEKERDDLRKEALTKVLEI